MDLQKWADYKLPISLVGFAVMDLQKLVDYKLWMVLVRLAVKCSEVADQSDM